MTRFDRDTAVTVAGDGVFHGRIDRGWWIQRGPNGGYVAAIVLRAMTMALADAARSPRSLTVHYLAAPQEGPVEVAVTVERSGRTLSYLSARMVQDGRLVATALAAFAVAQESSMEFQHLAMPDVPSAAETAPPPPGPVIVPMRERYETRFVVGAQPFSGADEAVSGGWIRLAEPRPVDHLLMAALADAWLPPIFTMVTGEQPVGVPTIDLTVHFRSPLPVPEMADDDFVFGLFRTSTSAGGFIEDDGDIWSPDGRLLAQCRQLALLMA